MRTYHVTIRSLSWEKEETVEQSRCSDPPSEWPAIEAISEHDALEAAMLLHELDMPTGPGRNAIPYEATINGQQFRLFWFVSFDGEGGNHDYHPKAERRRPLHSGIGRVPNREE